MASEVRKIREEALVNEGFLFQKKGKQELGMSVEYYNAQIASNQQAIASYQNEIIEMEEKIAELTAMKNRLISLQDELTGMASREVEKVGNARGLSAILNVNFWNQLLDALKGDEYSSAQEGLSISQEITQEKINQLRGSIEQKQNAISSCRTQITSLENQRAAFIAEQERKAAEARAKAEAEAKKEKK